MKKFQFKQHFVATFRHLTKTNMVLVYRSTIFGPLYHACTRPEISAPTLGGWLEGEVKEVLICTYYIE